MPNPRLATRYAKSLIDLSIEQNNLEAVNSDVEYLQSVLDVSPEFRSILASPVIKPSKKALILGAVTEKNVGDLSKSFFSLLLHKSRESVLPEILLAFKEQYNILKQINKVKLTTAHPLTETQKKAMIDKISAETGLTNIILDQKVDESLIGGFVLEYDNKLVDASLRYELNTIRKSFQRNDYIYNIR